MAAWVRGGTGGGRRATLLQVGLQPRQGAARGAAEARGKLQAQAGAPAAAAGELSSSHTGSSRQKARPGAPHGERRLRAQSTGSCEMRQPSAAPDVAVTLPLCTNFVL